ncbi:DUF2238 domain-containing protein [Psychrobacter sp. FDAARGOS_221]|uniref:DUF2238 domain-containing protein n=1 Tax=Psychrobacter sp. FDAARGOS_221 TaxID=1975705 RepID=UPI000BB57C6A|nr:DUF2238 domain-containing protein [Psychrobacter sp. FDAARGOS_221]PNK61967.1 DUF2238 domain-containing protein [Psychrobacter sp. FDAARGOS_221]
MILASIHPLNWNDYLLHQAGTIVFMAMVWRCYRKYGAKPASFAYASLFILIHIIGARYLYSYVPYNEWTQALFSFNLNEIFGWQRNMYDRLVHFSYGLLLLPLMRDVLRSFFPAASTKTLILLALQFNLASSALYELFEWILAIGLSSEAAEAYNGQQGDMWDAQKDMALAFLGGMVSALIYQLKAVSQSNKTLYESANK